MKGMFYPRLAWSGIRKNSRLYIPYLMTTSLMVAVYYILSFLPESGVMKNMRGGNSLGDILSLGSIVIAVFSVIFLIYTNALLIKNRRKEFGLYNVLGMNKRNIGKLLLWDTGICYLVSILAGLTAGVALSKLAELGLSNLISMDVNYSFKVPGSSLITTLTFYLAIFAVIFVIGIVSIKRNTVIELVKSRNIGERPPKNGTLLTAVGAALLAGAYYLAASIRQPLEAFIFFFIAVLMVIAATFCLFISGSVFMCRMLQKNKGFYYKASNFVSVSSMSFRMNRNGAGLASICILLTVIMVMLSGSACLFFGKESAIEVRYPRDICAFASKYGYDEKDAELIEKLNEQTEKSIKESSDAPSRLIRFREYCIQGYLEKGFVDICLNSASNMVFIDYNKVAEVHLMDLADYNLSVGENNVLKDGEALVCTIGNDDVSDVLKVGTAEFKVAKRIPAGDFRLETSDSTSVISDVYVIVNDIMDYVPPLDVYKDVDGTSLLFMRWFYLYDSRLSVEGQLSEGDFIRDNVRNTVSLDKAAGLSFNVTCRNGEKGDFYSAFGGLFFIGFLLSLVFIIAIVMIIYYKQLSEGYEDKSRFEIMQKLGMTKKDIRRSINRQMLLVFFLPILFAVLHLCFAFPLIYRILMLFGMMDLSLLLRITAVAVLACSAIYAIAYKLTSNAYYSIVSE